LLGIWVYYVVKISKSKIPNAALANIKNRLMLNPDLTDYCHIGPEERARLIVVIDTEEEFEGKALRQFF